MSSRGLLLPQNKCHFIHDNNDMKTQTKIPVLVAQTVHIDANSSKLIECNLDLHNIPLSYDQLKLKHLVASSESLQSDTPFHLLNVFFQYINMPITGKINLQYTNFATNSITLKSGDQIAIIEEMMSPQPWCQKVNRVHDTLKTNQSRQQSYPQFIDHPIFNQVYFACKILSRDQNTEADVAEKLSMIEYNGEKKIPQIQDSDINVQSTDPKHIQFAKNLVYSHKNLFTAHPLDIGTLQNRNFQFPQNFSQQQDVL